MVLWRIVRTNSWCVIFIKSQDFGCYIRLVLVGTKYRLFQQASVDSTKEKLIQNMPENRVRISNRIYKTSKTVKSSKKKRRNWRRRVGGFTFTDLHLILYSTSKACDDSRQTEISKDSTPFSRPSRYLRSFTISSEKNQQKFQHRFSSKNQQKSSKS
jgi:hypothetical protein